MADEARAFALQHVRVNARAVDVVHENFAAKFRRPIVTLINEQPGMGVAAADRTRTRTARVRPLAAGPVDVIGDRLDIVIDVGIKMRASLPVVASTLNNVEQVRDHAGLDKALAIWIEINAPGIARSFREHFEHLFDRMIAPHPGVDASAFAVGGAGLSDVRMGEHSMATVEPAVGSPGEGVEGVVGVLVSPAIQQDLWRARRFGFVAILQRNEHELRGGTDPDTTKAYLNATYQVQTLHEHGAAIKLAIPVAVLKNQDAILALALRRTIRVGVAFGNPEAATVVDCESDRLFYIGFASEKRGFEAGRQRHFFRGLFRRQPGKF